MSQKTIVITGASDGIGAAAARTLSEAGHRVVIVGRSRAKTEAVARELKADHFVADFSRLDDVRALAVDLLAACPRIDVLANNAGSITSARELSADGLEKTLQINHLAPFLLTTLLIDRLIESRATVIATSSSGNSLFGNLHIADLQNEHHYSPTRAYGNAKLCNILFTKRLDTLYAAQGLSTASFHPGIIATNFAAESSSLIRVLYASGARHVLRSARTGADTLVWLATSTPGTDWVRGEYFAHRKVARANKQAYDPELAIEVWNQSAALVGLAR